MLPSEISSLSLTSRISVRCETSCRSDRLEVSGINERTSSYCARLVVLWRVKRVGVQATGEIKIRKLGARVSSPERARGKRDSNITAAVGVESTLILPEEESVARSYVGYELVRDQALAKKDLL